MLKRLGETLGPGLLFAAAAVGVSHLVQSTRAGAEFGLAFAVPIVAVSLIKYPAFRFGAEYAAATGRSLIDGYERQGRWLLFASLAVFVVEGLAVVPAVSLVTAGITQNVLGSRLGDVTVTVSIILVASLLLMVGRYRLLENITRVFVVLFSGFTVVAAALAATRLWAPGATLAVAIAPSRDNLFFTVAVAGWMPIGITGSVFLSLWVCSRAADRARSIPPAEARLDFNVGFAASVALALCFLVMGTAMMLGRGMEISSGTAGFAAQLIGLFTQTMGEWAHLVIAVAALAVMFSTVLTVVDGFPRVIADIVARILAPRREVDQGRLYVVFLAAQAVAALLLLLLLLRSFAAFIDLATTAGFLTAPVLAALNHRAMFAGSVLPESRPSTLLRWWSLAGVAALTVAALAYLSFRFT